MVFLTILRLGRQTVDKGMYHLQKSLQKTNPKFIDSLHLKLTAGKGGDGLQLYNGIGGNGGDVLLQAEKTRLTLNEVLAFTKSRIIQANPGENSSKHRLIGNHAKSRVIRVPLGVAIYDCDKRLIANLDTNQEKVLIAKGGEGGSPSNNYVGQPGQYREIFVDLKLIADVGFVGFPNAGKSTLLTSISNATPKIASYAFTTLAPNIGVIEYSDLFKITCADLPGLIEGAHMNVGLGHEFLKHIDRTKLILIVIDASGFHYRPDWQPRNALETLLLLNRELELYDPALLEKPAILAITKIDKPGAKLKYKEFLESFRQCLLTRFEGVSDQLKPSQLFLLQDIIPLSSHTGFNIPFFKERLKRIKRRNFGDYTPEEDEEDLGILKLVDRKLNKIVEKR